MPSGWRTAFFRKFGNHGSPYKRLAVDYFLPAVRLIIALEGIRRTFNFLAANEQCPLYVQVIATLQTWSAIITHGTFMVKIHWANVVTNNKKDSKLFWKNPLTIGLLSGSYCALMDVFDMGINAVVIYSKMVLWNTPIQISLLTVLCLKACVALDKRINNADNYSKRILWYFPLNIVSGFCCVACVFFGIGMHAANPTFNTAICVFSRRQLLPFCLEFVVCVADAGWSWNYLRQKISDFDETSRPPSPTVDVEELSDE